MSQEIRAAAAEGQGVVIPAGGSASASTYGASEFAWVMALGGDVTLALDTEAVTGGPAGLARDQVLTQDVAYPLRLKEITTASGGSLWAVPSR